MSYDPEVYKDPKLVLALKERIAEVARELGRPVKIMHICGTHEHEIGRYGLRDLLPESVELLAGPGCPVCVCDAEYIDRAIQLALTPGVILASFGDMLAVPGGIPLRDGRPGDVRMSLLDAKARGGDVRAVYSVFDAARLARENPDKEVVFFSVGFETTVVAVAALLKRGAPGNFSLLEANYYTPPATSMLPTLEGFDVQGFLLPGHAAAITGLKIYEHLPRLGIACASAGFEPVDVLSGVLSVLLQLKEGKPRLENTYRRVIPYEGNTLALKELFEVFELVPQRWRGIGVIPDSGFRLREAYRGYSAEERFKEVFARPLPRSEREHPKGCRCAEVTLGLVRPSECPVFGKLCTPDNPYGPCMVSHEGTCRAWYTYGMDRGRIEVEV
ncbi:hydrogenase formation protein HypD [Thermus igniterrae]|uniref:hydrogenase formation protein HypD n=1 Tax=Thermus igniterrae TaxID=88189 RepID=UPI00037EAAB9|nr:hydrogenase formation protein HypD [Thermus igniterrae]